jgi:mycothiol S-conjugate amidase
MVRILREVRPHVVTAYNSFGGYGHPDHVRSAEIARAAFERAADQSAYPEHAADGLRPWQPLKLYEQTFEAGRRRNPELLALLAERGISSPWLPPPDETDEARTQRESWWEQMVAATGPLTTRVDIAEYVEHKLAAMREHVTQIAARSWFLAFSADEMRRFQGTEDYSLVESRLPVRLPESDLFAGLR